MKKKVIRIICLLVVISSIYNNAIAQDIKGTKGDILLKMPENLGSNKTKIEKFRKARKRLILNFNKGKINKDTAQNWYKKILNTYNYELLEKEPDFEDVTGEHKDAYDTLKTPAAIVQFERLGDKLNKKISKEIEKIYKSIIKRYSVEPSKPANKETSSFSAANNSSSSQSGIRNIIVFDSQYIPNPNASVFAGTSGNWLYRVQAKASLGSISAILKGSSNTEFYIAGPNDSLLKLTNHLATSSIGAGIEFPGASVEVNFIELANIANALSPSGTADLMKIVLSARLFRIQANTSLSTLSGLFSSSAQAGLDFVEAGLQISFKTDGSIVISDTANLFDPFVINNIPGNFTDLINRFIPGNALGFILDPILQYLSKVNNVSHKASVRGKQKIGSYKAELINRLESPQFKEKLAEAKLNDLERVQNLVNEIIKALKDGNVKIGVDFNSVKIN